MTWRSKKKKEVPIEEALERAQLEAKEYWFEQKPIFLVFPHGGTMQFRFLKPENATKAWLFVFVDPTEYSGQRLLHCVDEYHRRFSICGFNFILVLCPRYRQLFAGPDGERAINQQIIRKFQISFPMTLDSKLMLSMLFKANFPHIAILSAGKLSFQMSGDRIFANLESELQKFIHATDPGVAFLQPFEAGKGVPSSADFSTLEFGRGHPAATTARFIGGSFEKGGPGDFFVGNFEAVQTLKLPGEASQEVLLQGSWLQDGERLITADPQASLTFEAQGSHVALVGHAVPKAKAKDKDAVEMMMSDAFIEVNGVNPLESQVGDAASIRFDGRAVAKVGRAGFYPLIADLPPGRKTITLRFDSASEVPIAIYGLRFGINR